MAPIYLEEIVLTSMVTLLAAHQLWSFADGVANVRRIYRIAYPYVVGNENFERAFRAQQNSLEFFPVFMITLWVSSIFFHQVPSSFFGLVYIWSRYSYFKGYCNSVPERIPGFQMSVQCLRMMFIMALAGLTTMFLRQYGDVDLAEVAHAVVLKILGVPNVRIAVY